MKELSYHILDIANNSVRGKAKNITITVIENTKKNLFTMIIEDDGIGIEPAMLETIKNPFTTSRTFRKVGLGIPFLNDTCVTCAGKLELTSEVGLGTKVVATMEYDHIDRPPLGDMPSTMMTLMTTDQNINVKYLHQVNDKEFDISTSDLLEVLGGDVSLNTPDVMLWLKDYLKENIKELK